MQAFQEHTEASRDPQQSHITTKWEASQLSSQEWQGCFHLIGAPIKFGAFMVDHHESSFIWKLRFVQRQPTCQHSWRISTMGSREPLTGGWWLDTLSPSTPEAKASLPKTCAINDVNAAGASWIGGHHLAPKKVASGSKEWEVPMNTNNATERCTSSC